MSSSGQIPEFERTKGDQRSIGKAWVPILSVKADSELSDLRPNGNTFAAGKSAQSINAASGDVSKVKRRIREFGEYSKVLMDVLDQVEKIHPFIGVAVLAFKTVVSLELKRRDNDDKVIVLLLKVQDMMEVLVQLRFIAPNAEPDQPLSVREKLSTICNKIEEDIKECGNLCDAYSKKNLIGANQSCKTTSLTHFHPVKLLKGPIYEQRLAECGETFETRQKELELALMIFTAQGVHSTTDALPGMQDTLSGTSEHIQMLVLFQVLQTDTHRRLSELVKSKGGPQKCMQDEKVLAELVQIYNDSINRQKPNVQASSQSPEVLRPTNMHYYARPTGYEPAPSQTYPQGPMHDESYAMPLHTTYRHTGRHYQHQHSRHRQRSFGYSHSAPGLSMVPEPGTYGSGESRQNRQSDPEVSNRELQALKKELENDVDIDLKNNVATFLRKFIEQQRQLVVQLERTIVREGDRVVSAVREGPHDRILDEELREIWKEMGWKLVVPTTEFVLTLHDYYVSQHHDMRVIDHHFASLQSSPSITDEKAVLAKVFDAAKRRTEEKWALKSLDISNLEPVSEVFDGDASGYVSIWEANQITSLRPVGWSLLQWLAYWASGKSLATVRFRRSAYTLSVGRHYTISQYCSKIQRLLQDMHILLKEHVLPLNRYGIDRYLDGMEVLERVLAFTYQCKDPPEGELAQRVSAYAQTEEYRMERVLQALEYEIDSSDTIELVTSRYQMERHFFPLMYLLLRRHVSVVRLACDVALEHREMDVAISSMNIILGAVKARVATLRELFFRRGLDPNWKLQMYAFGMYRALDEDMSIPYLPISETQLSTPEADVVGSVGWLRYGIRQDECEPQCPGFDDPPRLDSCIGHFMNGFWTGHFLDEADSDVCGLVQFRVSNWSEMDGSFDGEGCYYRGTLKVTGTFSRGTHSLHATFTRKEDGDEAVGDDRRILVSGSLNEIVFTPQLPNQYAISGRWCYSADEPQGRVEFWQKPAWTYQLNIPHAHRQLKENVRERARRYWRLALDAARYQIRCERRVCHKTSLEMVKRIQKSVVLLKKQRLNMPLLNSETSELRHIASVAPPMELRLSSWLARFAYWPPVHL
ncbi:hypothetical protein VNI00_006414 [Paramarasmius palmivorus]|uniref:Uncharacterized protein n=1 Tax=Paramarasmius palmivorus TaxID=297713 RepID=A0AAW0D7Y8_9AGAR